MSTPKYKLRFFNTMSYAESIRFIFAYANVPYEDIRIEREDWPKLKETTPWGKLPVLELEDGTILSQSRAIGRYLGRQHGLVGETDLEGAKIDEYVDVIDDMREECIKYFHERDDSKKQEKLKHLDEVAFPSYFDKFTSIIATTGSGYLVGGKLSIADICLTTSFGQLANLLETSQLLVKYPAIKQHMDLVLSQPGIKEWVGKRPVTRF